MSGYTGAGDINVGVAGKDKDSVVVNVNVYCVQYPAIASGLQAGISTSTSGNVNFMAGDYIAKVGNKNDDTSWVGTAIAAKDSINIDTENFAVSNAKQTATGYEQAVKTEALKVMRRSNMVLLDTDAEPGREQVGEN